MLVSGNASRRSYRRSGIIARITMAGALVFTASLPGTIALAAPRQTSQTADTPKQPGVPFTSAQLNTLLPPSVYFQGKTAPLQLRNAGGVSFGPQATVWAALVDASGYATSIQERYQFYLVTETPLQVGDAHVAAGAYGGGFVKDRFLLMDLGGHTVAEGATGTDAAMPRPRPLQLLPESADSAKLYLGRHWVRLHAGASPDRPAAGGAK